MLYNINNTEKNFILCTIIKSFETINKIIIAVNYYLL